MRRFFIISVALLASLVASAQETNVATVVEQNGTTSIDTQIKALDVRAKKSEKRLAALEKVRQYAKVSAFMQGEYDWVSDANDKGKTGTSSFYLRRVRFSLTGDLYKGKAGKLDYRLYFDLARVKLPNPNPILDMWIKYQPIKEFGVQFGQFKNPITFEASISPAKYDFIDFSYAVCNLAKMGSDDVAGYNVTARDAGFQVFGGFIHRDGYSIINYNVGVLNGSGINVKDDNKSKDIFGKLTIKPTHDFALAAYYQWGEANLSGIKSSDSAKWAEYGWNGNAEYVTTHRWGGGFNYDGKHAFARAEYLGGLTGKLASEGLYVEGGYRHHLPKNAGMMWLGGMVDYFCRNTFDYIHRDTPNAAVNMRYSLCFGYQPIKYFRIQLAYSLKQNINTPASIAPFENSVKLMATASF